MNDACQGDRVPNVQIVLIIYLDWRTEVSLRDVLSIEECEPPIVDDRKLLAPKDSWSCSSTFVPRPRAPLRRVEWFG